MLDVTVDVGGSVGVVDGDVVGVRSSDGVLEGALSVGVGALAGQVGGRAVRSILMDLNGVVVEGSVAAVGVDDGQFDADGLAGSQ